MKHKHHNEIIAWANGAQIEWRKNERYNWSTAVRPIWENDYEYRVKPTPKPDVVKSYFVAEDGFYSNTKLVTNLKLTYDGETGKLKASEVI
jgi:hypothetical protein